jgi:hypothetical protein
LPIIVVLPKEEVMITRMEKTRYTQRIFIERLLDKESLGRMRLGA